MRAGTCAKTAESGRNGVQVDEEGCTGWIRRSPERRKTDAIRQSYVSAAASNVNAAARARRRR